MYSPKLDNWGGANKARVRLFKKHDIQKFVGEEIKRTGNREWKPNILSFPGPTAILERLLVNHGVIKPDNITAIQTYEKLSEKHEGGRLLKKLIRTRQSYLSGMYIWPYNFHTFSNKYTIESCSPPSSSKQAIWAKPPYKRFMNQITSKPTNKFSIMDLDLCGIFSQKNSDSIVNLFKNGVTESSGLMFITHQKGRDVGGGKLFDVLYGYLRCNEFLDFDSIPNIYEEGYETYVARYTLVPLYYMCKAFEYGFTMKMNRLIEYRDLNEDGVIAVNMLQYFFSWEKTGTSNKEFIHNILDVINEEYDYFNLVD